MTGSLSTQPKSREVRTLDDPRPNAAKAHLRGPKESDVSAGGRNESDRRIQVDEFCAVIWAALVAGHGSVGAAAITLDNTDPSQLKRQVARGTLTLEILALADASAKADLGARLLEKYGHARKTPQQKIAELVSHASQQLQEAMQLALRLDGQK